MVTKNQLNKKNNASDRKEITTKQRILEESMKLFSVNGFEAVSIRTIAQKVGITNSGLYKHFKSKRDIFDTLVLGLKENYINKCRSIVNTEIRGTQQIKSICLEMFRYQSTDKDMVVFRRLLTIEQFKSVDMSALYKEIFIDIPLRSQEKIFEELMKQGLMKKCNAKLLAMELYAPFFMYHTVKYNKNELIKLFEDHIESFYENNIIK